MRNCIEIGSPRMPAMYCRFFGMLWPLFCGVCKTAILGCQNCVSLSLRKALAPVCALFVAFVCRLASAKAWRRSAHWFQSYLHIVFHSVPDHEDSPIVRQSMISDLLSIFCSPKCVGVCVAQSNRSMLYPMSRTRLSNAGKLASNWATIGMVCGFCNSILRAALR